MLRGVFVGGLFAGLGVEGRKCRGQGGAGVRVGLEDVCYW